MSWEYWDKIVKCPCGSGVIRQEVRSDDWGRVEESTPVIECEECAEKYSVEARGSSGPVPRWKQWVAYYLTPKNYPPFKLPDDFIIYNKSSSIRDNFIAWLIESYEIDALTGALEELQAVGNCSKVKGTAKDIVASKRRSDGAATVATLIPAIRQAINDYGSHEGNFSQRRDSLRDIDRLRDIYEHEKRKHQTLLQI